METRTGPEIKHHTTDEVKTGRLNGLRLMRRLLDGNWEQVRVEENKTQESQNTENKQEN